MNGVLRLTSISILASLLGCVSGPNGSFLPRGMDPKATVDRNSDAPSESSDEAVTPSAETSDSTSPVDPTQDVDSRTELLLRQLGDASNDPSIQAFVRHRLTDSSSDSRSEAETTTAQPANPEPPGTPSPASNTTNSEPASHNAPSPASTTPPDPTTSSIANPSPVTTPPTAPISEPMPATTAAALPDQQSSRDPSALSPTTAPAPPATQASQPADASTTTVAALLPDQNDSVEPKTLVQSPDSSATNLSPSDLQTNSSEPQSPANLTINTPSETAAASSDASGSDHKPSDITDDWVDQLENAYQALDRYMASEAGAMDGPQREQLEVRKRLLAIAAGKRDAALADIEPLSPELQQFWKEQTYALLTLTEPDELDLHANFRIGDRKRFAVGLDHLRQAEASLADEAALRVHRVALCDRVEGFGKYHEFPRASFRGDDRLVIYCEVDNFRAETRAGDQGEGQLYETELQGSVVILDQDRREVNLTEYQPILDRCRFRRRDFYLHFTYTIPRDLPAGRYFVSVVLEDLKAKKTTSSAPIELEIR